VRVLLHPIVHDTLELAIDVRRQYDLQSNELIAKRAGADILDPLSAQAQDLPAGCTLGNRDSDPAVDRWHLDAGAKNGLVQRYRNFERNIIAVAPEKRVRLDLELDQCIARLAAACAWAAFMLQAKRLPALNA